MRRLAALLAAVGMLAATAVPAQAHGGDNLGLPIIEQRFPAVDGVDFKVVFSANYQFLATNTTATDLFVLADSGEPFLRLGPQGAFGNFHSPTWYSVNVPEGMTRFPPEAKPGAEVAPDWRPVSRQPTYGWFDHRLHPAERYVKDDIQKSKVPVRVGDWAVPLRYGAEEGKLTGRFEFQPRLGEYRSTLRSPEAPAEGVKVQLAASSTAGGVPAMFVENRSADPVVVLGDDDEPFVRLAGRAEVNLRSPAWAALEQARGRILTTAADSRAEPEWQQVQDTPRWGWAELRAAPPRANPDRKVLDHDGPSLVKAWSIPLLIGDRRTAIEGVTEFLPAAASDREAKGDPGGSGASPGNKDSKGGLVAFMALGVFAVLGGMFAARKSKAAKAAEEAAADRPKKLGRIKRR